MENNGWNAFSIHNGEKHRRRSIHSLRSYRFLFSRQNLHFKYSVTKMKETCLIDEAKKMWPFEEIERRFYKTGVWVRNSPKWMADVLRRKNAPSHSLGIDPCKDISTRVEICRSAFYCRLSCHRDEAGLVALCGGSVQSRPQGPTVPV